MNSIRISILIASFALLLYALSTVVFQKERLLASGKPYKFKVRPVDPADPFRGRYIVLNFEANSFKVAAENRFVYGRSIYVLLGTDSAGFAMIRDVSLTEPASGDYVKASLDYPRYDKHEIVIDYPFETFYMEESKAPKAERALSGRADSLRSVYAKVYVKNGESAIENVYVNDQPLLEYLGMQK